MSAVELSELPEAGMPRILHHCEVGGRLAREPGPARDRLARVLGRDLASRLVCALGRHGRRASA